jgi:hypothetical protein
MKTIGMAALSVLAAMSASAQAPTRVKAEQPVAKTASLANAAVEKPKETRAGTQPSKRLKAQQEAMKELAFLDGEWRGASKVLRKDGWAPTVQTGRVGTVLDGTVRMIEAKGYEASGRQSFEVLRIISYEPETKTYFMRSYQSGRVRDHAVSLTDKGFEWESESSGDTTIRYEASVKDGAWTETATRVPARGEPETYVEVKLKRLRSGSWPSALGLPGK